MSQTLASPVWAVRLGYSSSSPKPLRKRLTRTKFDSESEMALTRFCPSTLRKSGSPKTVRSSGRDSAFLR